MPQHSEGDARKVASDLGWREARRSKKGYSKFLCPCGQHFKWFHKTPSDPNYWKNVIAYLKRICPDKGKGAAKGA
jgi:hypothetical protein